MPNLDRFAWGPLNFSGGYMPNPQCDCGCGETLGNLCYNIDGKQFFALDCVDIAGYDPEEAYLGETI